MDSQTVGRVAAVIACAIGCLSVPSIAEAGTAYLTGNGQSKVLHFDAAPGESNSLQVQHAIGTTYFLIGDIGIQAGAGCTPDGPFVDCPDSGVTSAVFNLGDGNDHFTTTVGAVFSFPVTINGGEGADSLSTWSSGQDTVDGGPGNDGVFPYTGGADDLHGGDGRDVFVAAGQPGQPYATSLNDTADDGDAGQQMNVHSDFEEVQGGIANDVISGTPGADTLDGGFGSDVVHGGGGADSVSGGQGGCGVDTDQVYGDDGADTVENRTSGTLDGGLGDDTLHPLLGCGGITVSGGDGTDTADLSQTTWPVLVSLDGVANDFSQDGPPPDDFGPDIERLIGTPQDDVLIGSSGDNYIDGGAGDDLIDGAGGADDLHGGDGDDVVDYESRTQPLTVDIGGAAGNDGQAGEGDTVASDFEGIWSGAGADTLTGGPNSDDIDGGPGADVISGGPGFDAVDYSIRTERVWADPDGQTGDDGEAGEGDTVAPDIEAVFGGDGPDELGANPLGWSYLFGGPGDDHLMGGSHYSALIGEEGNDFLVGGIAGEDFFGGPGDDSINADDQVPETPECGDGADKVQVDEVDKPDADCEQVTKLVPAAAPPPPQITQPPPFTPQTPIQTAPAPSQAVLGQVVVGTAPKGTLSLKRVRLGQLLRRGQPVFVSCTGACGATLTATISAAAARGLGLRSRRPVEIARVARLGSDGSSFSLVVQPFRRYRSKLGRARKLTVTLHLVTTNAARLTSSADRVVTFRR